MLWRGSVLFHPPYDADLHMQNYDSYLNLCQAVPLEYVCKTSLIALQGASENLLEGLPYVSINVKCRSLGSRGKRDYSPQGDDFRRLVPRP